MYAKCNNVCNYEHIENVCNKNAQLKGVDEIFQFNTCSEFSTIHICNTFIEYIFFQGHV